MRIHSFILFLLLPAYCFSQAGLLDSTFGANGIASFFPNTGCSSVAIQNDGKIITGGGFSDHFGLVRFNTNGSLDSSFGTDGKVETTVGIGFANSEMIVLQSDGRIIEGGFCVDNSGSYVFALARFDTEGTLDFSFGSNGIVLTSLSDVGYPSAGIALAIQPDGKIVQVGSSSNYADEIDFATARFNTDGSLDNSFGTNGKVLTPIGNQYAYATCVAVQQDGKIVVGGRSESLNEISFAIVRYNSDGTLDNSFSSDGKDTVYFSSTDSYVMDKGLAIVLQPDGKILMTGKTYSGYNSFHGISILRYSQDGTLDSSFGGDGKVIVLSDSIGYFPNSMAIQPDGKILIGGYGGLGLNPALMLARFNSDGSLDSSFGLNGIVIKVIQWPDYGAISMALQADGKIVTGGKSGLGWTVARFLSGLNVGMLDLSVDDLPILIYPNPIQSEATLEYLLVNEECITISLYNMLGSRVQNFIVNEIRNRGEHKETFDLDSTLPSGEYILSISNSIHSQSIKITKLK